jgi:hypothetical protein
MHSQVAVGQQQIPVNAKMGQSGLQRDRKLAMYPRRVYTKMARARRLLAICAALAHSSSLTRPSSLSVSSGRTICPCFSCLQALHYQESESMRVACKVSRHVCRSILMMMSDLQKPHAM